MKGIGGLGAIVSAGVLAASAFFGYARGEEGENYFAANYFMEDKNGNKLADPIEFEGYDKNVFGCDERTSFCAIVQGRKDKTLLLRIVDEKRKIVKEVKDYIYCNKWSFFCEVDNLEPGKYIAIWKKDGILGGSELARRIVEKRKETKQQLKDSENRRMHEDLEQAMRETKEEFLQDLRKREEKK